MKKTILMVAIMAQSVAAMAQNDTINIARPDSVSIVRGNDNVSINVYGSAENPDYFYSMDFYMNTTEPVKIKENTRRMDFDLSIPLFGNENRTYRTNVEVCMDAGFLFGYNITSGAPADIDINAFKSMDIWIPGLLSINYSPSKKFNFDLDYGLEWRNYRMNDNNRFNLTDDKKVERADYPTDCKPDFSRIKVLSQTLSLTGRYRFCKSGYLRVGPVFSFNNGLSVKTKYKDANGKTIKEKQNNPKVNTFSLEWLADLQVHGIGFWVKYSPKDVLREGYGPQFSTTTVGISLGW